MCVEDSRPAGGPRWPILARADMPAWSTSRMDAQPAPASRRPMAVTLATTVSIPLQAGGRLDGFVKSARMTVAPSSATVAASVSGRTRHRTSWRCSRSRRTIRPPNSPVPPTTRIISWPCTRRHNSRRCLTQRRPEDRIVLAIGLGSNWRYDRVHNQRRSRCKAER